MFEIHEVDHKDYSATKKLPFTAFYTVDRYLEQFLFFHDIWHFTNFKNKVGHTVWCYAETDELLRIVREYQLIQVKRNQRKRESERKRMLDMGIEMEVEDEL